MLGVLKFHQYVPTYVGHLSFFFLTPWSFHPEELYYARTKGNFKMLYLIVFFSSVLFLWNSYQVNMGPPDLILCHRTFIFCLGPFALF